MNATTHTFTRGPVGATLLRFALPILGGYVLQSVSHSLHAAWVGRSEGALALAAVTQANHLLFALIAMVFGISQAAGILVAQAIGAGALPYARRVAGTGAGLALGSSIVLAAAGGPLAPYLLEGLHTPQAVVPLAQDYLQLILLTLPLQMVFIFTCSVLRGAGDARRPFYFLLGSVVLDAVLGPALILGWGPVPRMGTAGSALALLLSQGLSLATLLAWMRWSRHSLWIGSRERHLFAPDWRITQALVCKGLPLGLQMVVVSCAMVALQAIVNRQGEYAALGYSAAMQLWTYVQMPGLAVGAACTSMAAQCVGAGHGQRIHRIARSGVVCSVVLTGAMVGLVLLMDRQVLSLFLPPDSSALTSARHINQIVLGSFLALGVSAVLAGMVRATGAVWAPLLILTIALWAIRLPIAAALQPWWGVDALWWSFPVSALCSLLLSLAYYRWGRWQHTSMVDFSRVDAPVKASAAT